ncbi:MAG: histidine phosphatase family protein [Lachnospiraceae bacterium]
MGTIYYTRHGQTIWNVENKICGATDIALTDLGRQQAQELGELLKKRRQEGSIHIDEILYSPLMRARDTALKVSEITGIPAREEIRLKEQNFGKYESTPRDGEEFKLAKQNFINHFEGGETMLHLCQRIYNLLDDLKKEPEKIYLLVAHNGIYRVIQSYFYDMTNEEFASTKMKNCELKEYHF